MPSKKQIGYKVVYPYDGKLLSSFVGRCGAGRTSPFIRTYAIGELTKPARGTKLFAFLTLESARTYAKIFDVFDLQIYKAELYNAVKNGWLESYYSDIVQLFKDHKLSVWARPVQGLESSCICTSIRLLEKVES